MQSDLKITANEIDLIIRKDLWFDFHVYKYENGKLIIAGSADLLYYHTLEIIFENVHFFHGPFNEWKSDTTQTVFSMSEDDQMNVEFEIEQGYSAFIFKTEDYNNNVIIVAEKVTFNTDTVFYYKRDDLKENERLAYFVPR